MGAPADLRAARGRGPVERACAWLLTGPLGHLYAVLADICVMAARQLALAARRRIAR